LLTAWPHEEISRAVEPKAEAGYRPRLFDISETPHPNGLLYDVIEGRPTVYPHAKQRRVLESRRIPSPPRFVIVLSGVRAGKTSAGPFWMADVMQDQGPGFYLLVAPNFPLLEKAAVPDVQDVMGRLLGLGDIYNGARGYFRISPEGHAKLWPDIPYDPRAKQSRLIFGYAGSPESLAAITAKGAWIDECGQKSFKQESHFEINARVSTTSGPVLYTSRPYQPGWFQDVCEAAELEPKTDLIHYESRDNPTFPMEEWDRQERLLPPYKFNIMYRGVFDRPAGLIYDAFTAGMIRTSYSPPAWARIFVGIDFGAPNFAAVFFAEIEGPPRYGQGRMLVAWAEYRPQENRTAKEHVEAMRGILNGRKVATCVAGSYSEEQERMELNAAGWSCQRPDQPEVEVGIERVYSCMRDDRFAVTRDCPLLLRELASYSRPTDEAGNVLEGIDEQNDYHGLDSVRYIIGTLERKATNLFFINLTKSKTERETKNRLSLP
jgi:hypothetical protein